MALSVCRATFTVTSVPTPASVVPPIVGVGSFVAALLVIITIGAVVSTVRVCVLMPVLPAGSVTETTTVFLPVASFAGVTLQVPPVRTVALSVCPATFTVTSVSTPASVVPLIVGVTLFVVALLVIITIGAVVSTVRAWVALAGFPAASETVAVTV